MLGVLGVAPEKKGRDKIELNFSIVVSFDLTRYICKLNII